MACCFEIPEKMNRILRRTTSNTASCSFSVSLSICRAGFSWIEISVPYSRSVRLKLNSVHTIGNRLVAYHRRKESAMTRVVYLRAGPGRFPQPRRVRRIMCCSPHKYLLLMVSVNDKFPVGYSPVATHTETHNPPKKNAISGQ